MSERKKLAWKKKRVCVTRRKSGGGAWSAYPLSQCESSRWLAGLPLLAGTAILLPHGKSEDPLHCSIAARAASTTPLPLESIITYSGDLEGKLSRITSNCLLIDQASRPCCMLLGAMVALRASRGFTSRRQTLLPSPEKSGMSISPAVEGSHNNPRPVYSLRVLGGVFYVMQMLCKNV